MPGFSRIEIDGFRRLRDVKLELRPLNVLIGGNGVGKTSLLDALALLASGANSELGTHLAGLGGIGSVRSALRRGRPTIRLAVTCSDPSLGYNLELSQQG